MTSCDVSDSSQTQVKTVFQVENNLSSDFRHDLPDQHFPVRLPVRTVQSSSGLRNKANRNQRTQENTHQRQPDKTVLIGDSILHPINTKCLVSGVHK